MAGAIGRFIGGAASSLPSAIAVDTIFKLIEKTQPQSVPLQQPAGKGFITPAVQQQQIIERERTANFYRQIYNKFLAPISGMPELELLDPQAVVEQANERTNQQLEQANKRQIELETAIRLGERRIAEEAATERQRLQSQEGVIRAEETRRGIENKAFLEGYLKNVLARPQLENSAVAVELAKGG